MSAALIPAKSRGRCGLSLPSIVQEGGLLPHRLFDRPFLATVATSTAGIAAWIGSVNWVGTATATVGVASILVLGFNHLRQQIRSQQLKWEDENRSTLTGQLEAARAAQSNLNAQLAQLNASIKAERESLHAQRRETQAQSAQLQLQLMDVTEQLVATTRELANANRKIGELMAEVEKLRLGTARQTATVLKEVAGTKRETQDHAVAIAELQRLSGDNLPAFPDPNATPPHGTPVVQEGPR